MASRHPSPEIPRALVDKIVARRGRLHAYESADPARTALVVIDLDAGSCARESELAEQAIGQVNEIADRLRGLGGTIAFVTSRIDDPDGLARRLGQTVASAYIAETELGGVGTVLAGSLRTDPQDLRSVKGGASAFFPGSCALHDQLQDRDITSVLIAGLMTNICCESSGRDACELGYEVTMISDAMVGQSFGLHEASLATFFRFFGDVRPTADVLELLDRAVRTG